MKKKMFILSIAVLGASCLTTSCSGSGLIKPDFSKDGVKLGILKYVNATPLNDAHDGFLDVLDENNITYTLQDLDANADSNLVASQSLTLAAESNLVLGIATPAATGLLSARKTKSRLIPTLFTAVTDPVYSGLVEANDKATNNVTGTSDMNPVADQIKLFKRINPNINKIGIIYNSSETNSAKQKDLAQVECTAEGITLEVGTFSATNEISTVMNKLVERGIQGLYTPTDNNVFENYETIRQITDKAGIFIISGEESLIPLGAVATKSINYEDLGRLTGEIAVKIIKGEDVSNLPVLTLDNTPLIISTTNASAIGITIPQDLIDEAEEVR